MARPSLIFRQLFEKESSTYTYILGCPSTREAILIDPVLETAERDATVIKDLNLILKTVLNTHCHADHVTGSAKLKALLGGGLKSAIAKASGADADVLLENSDKCAFGTRHVTVLSTPGHTDGCVCFLLDDNSMVFTGDALMIRACGRTDFQAGSADTLYESVHNKLFVLEEDCLVYPAHDYKGHTCSSIREEKALNPRLSTTRPHSWKS